jgi:hypothetical protein
MDTMEGTAHCAVVAVKTINLVINMDIVLAIVQTLGIGCSLFVKVITQ